MTETLDRRIALATVPNLRDLGGLPVATGTVRPRRVFRSATLSRVEHDDGIALRDLGVRTIYDLRTIGERSSDPDRVPEGIEDVGLDVLADSDVAVAAKVQFLLDDPKALIAELGNASIVDLLADSYRDIVQLPSALSSYRALFLGIADADEDAILFHCTTGKDRTGWGAAALLLLLGADEDTVRADYLQTNKDLLPSLAPLLARLKDQGIDMDLVMPGLMVQDSYLDAAFDQMRTRFGSIEDYAARGLGLDDRTIARIRTNLIDPVRSR